MSGVEAVKKQAKTFKGIQEWIYEVPLECRCYDKPIHQERLKVKWIPEADVLPFIADLKEKNKKLKGFKEIAQILLDQNEGLEDRLAAIQKHCQQLKHKISQKGGFCAIERKQIIDEILGLVGEEQ